MINTSLEKILEYAKNNCIPRVIEMQCPKCGQTIYAVTDDDTHEHTAWLETLKQNRTQRYVSCKRCGYGMFAGEGAFVFKTHHVAKTV